MQTNESRKSDLDETSIRVKSVQRGGNIPKNLFTICLISAGMKSFSSVLL